MVLSQGLLASGHLAVLGDLGLVEGRGSWHPVGGRPGVLLNVLQGPGHPTAETEQCGVRDPAVEEAENRGWGTAAGAAMPGRVRV